MLVSIALLAGSASSFAAEKISASVKFLSPATNQEIKSVRVGRSMRVKTTIRNFDLLANKNVTVTYALSVTPKGSNTPVTVSGKLSGKLTLPSKLGGSQQTTKDFADLKGTQSGTDFITIPDFMPAGVATVTITISTKNVGSASVSKKLNLVL